MRPQAAVRAEPREGPLPRLGPFRRDALRVVGGCLKAAQVTSNLSGPRKPTGMRNPVSLLFLVQICAASKAVVNDNDQPGLVPGVRPPAIGLQTKRASTGGHHGRLDYLNAICVWWWQPLPPLGGVARGQGRAGTFGLGIIKR